MVDKLSNENGSITNNMVWSVTERVTSQILSTIVSVILARLLYPEAYATVALVTVFINLATVVMSSSFSSALIYDKEYRALFNGILFNFISYGHFVFDVVYNGSFSGYLL